MASVSKGKTQTLVKPMARWASAFAFLYYVQLEAGISGFGADVFRIACSQRRLLRYSLALIPSSFLKVLAKWAVSE